MRVHLAVGLLIAVLLSGCGTDRQVSGAPIPVATTSAVDPAADAAAIRSTFEKYRAELLAQNGPGVPPLVSPRTIGHYDQVVRLAQKAGPAEIAGAGMMDRIMIARLRVEMPPEQLATLDGARLLIYGVDEGMIDASSVDGHSLGEVRVEGDRGFAEMLLGSEPTGVDWEFVRVGPGWTFDLAAGFPLINDTLSQAAAESDLSEDEFVFDAVSMVTGLPVDATVFAAP